jgi:hypothetical protein
MTNTRRWVTWFSRLVGPPDIMQASALVPNT